MRTAVAREYGFTRLLGEPVKLGRLPPTGRESAATGAFGRSSKKRRAGSLRIGEGQGSSGKLSPSEARERLAALVVPVADPIETVSSDEATARLGLKHRQSVLDRYRRGELIGFETARRGVRFPAEQFLPDGTTLPGTVELLELFDGNGHRLWRWLEVSTNLLEGSSPIEALRDGELDRVLGAAAAHIDGAYG